MFPGVPPSTSLTTQHVQACNLPAADGICPTKIQYSAGIFMVVVVVGGDDDDGNADSVGEDGGEDDGDGNADGGDEDDGEDDEHHLWSEEDKYFQLFLKERRQVPHQG